MIGLWWAKCSSTQLEWRFDLSSAGGCSITLLMFSILDFGSSCKGTLKCTICLVSLHSAEQLPFGRRWPLTAMVVDPWQVTSSSSCEDSLADTWRDDWWEPFASVRAGRATGLSGDAGGVLQGLFGNITKEEHRLNGTLVLQQNRLLSWMVLCFSEASGSKMLLLLQYPASLAMLLLHEPPSELVAAPPSLPPGPPSSTLPSTSPLGFPQGCSEICRMLFLLHPPVLTLGISTEEYRCKLL